MDSSSPDSHAAAISAGTGDLFSSDLHRILVVDDDADDALLITDLLAETGMQAEVQWRRTVDGALAALSTEQYSVCLLDYRLGPETGISVLEAAAHDRHGVPVIVLTGHYAREVDLAAMQAGAVDFLSKDGLQPAMLERALRYAIEQARRQAALLRMARRDPLTGAHNRVGVQERLEQACRRSERSGQMLTVALIDLDGFKAVNDVLGHAAGDALLCEVTERLRAAVRPYDLVGRIGGDEFVVVTEGRDSPEQAERFAERLVTALQPPLGLPDTAPRVSASVGYVCATGSKLAPKALLASADRAMYAAKRQGGGRACAHQDVPSATGQLHNAHDLKEAIANEEMQVWMQPQLCLRNQEVVGLEALARWVPRSGQAVFPAAFLPKLASTGAVLELDLWILEQSLAWWRAAGRPVPRLCVNMAAQNLLQPNLHERVAAIVAGDAQSVEIEWTDVGQILGQPAACEQLQFMEQAGLRFALHSFGSAESSLLALRKLPVHTLKLDSGLCGGPKAQPQDLAVVEALVLLAQRLGLCLVAERIEESERTQTVLNLGIERGQGYALCRPMPIRKVQDWLHQSRHTSEARVGAQ